MTNPNNLARQVAETGGPVDVVIDSLWGPYAMPALSGLKSRGRYVNLGQSAGAEANVDSGLLRHRSINLTGLSGATIPPDRARAAFADLMRLATAGLVSLPTRVYELDHVAQAWQEQAAGSPGVKLILHP